MDLLPEKAVWWPSYQALLLADVHLGKTEHFRRNGLGVPHLELRENARLEGLIATHKPQVVYLLGDLFHSSFNNAWLGFEGLLNRWSQVRFVLVAGNHDILGAEHYAHPNLEVVAGVEIGPFELVHDPADAGGKKYFLAGHLHPVVHLSGKAKQRLRLPAFLFGPQGGYLPAFGAFTGGFAPEITPGWEVYPVIPNQVIKT